MNSEYLLCDVPTVRPYYSTRLPSCLFSQLPSLIKLVINFQGRSRDVKVCKCNKYRFLKVTDGRFPGIGYFVPYVLFLQRNCELLLLRL